MQKNVSILNSGKNSEMFILKTYKRVNKFKRVLLYTVKKTSKNMFKLQNRSLSFKKSIGLQLQKFFGFFAFVSV